MRVIELTDDEVQGLIDLMDAGVKHRGLAAAQNAAILLAKIQASPSVDPEAKSDPKPKK